MSSAVTRRSGDPNALLHDLLNRRRQRGHLVRLLQHFETVGSADLLAIAGGQQDRQLRVTVADFARELEAAEAARHDDVGKDEPRPIAVVEAVERFLGTVNDRGLESQLLQHSRREVGDHIVVLDDQHAPACLPVADQTAVFFPRRTVVSGEVDRETGMLVNIKTIDNKVREGAVELVRAHAKERALALGKAAAGLLERMTLLLAGKVSWVEGVAVAVSPYLKVEARREEMPMVRLSQRFEFSAAHRLHSPTLSESENWEVFGRCTNPNGHGHNYEVQVTLKGTPDERGVVVKVPEFERVVAETVIDRFDHKRVSEFFNSFP